MYNGEHVLKFINLILSWFADSCVCHGIENLGS